jgi:hypothetical protein
MKKATLSLAPFSAGIKDSYVFVSRMVVCIIAGTGTSYWQHVTKSWKEMLDAMPICGSLFLMIMASYTRLNLAEVVICFQTISLP